MRVLVAGGRGMLGSDLVRVLDGHDVAAPGHAELDITDPDAVRAAAAGRDLVINAAAYTKVDDAESHESEALAVNATGAGVLAAAAAEVGARFVHVSTDYVFDGTATSPYAEDAPLAPLGAYGRTKAEGERLVRAAHPGALIVRGAWLYGADGGNFAATMLRLIADRDHVDVVTDQLGQPTWTADLARAILSLVEVDAPAGIYHGTNAGTASWFDFARAVFAANGIDPERVHPTDSSRFLRPAPRPAYSVLGHDAWSRVGLAAPRDWRDALADAVATGAVRA